MNRGSALTSGQRLARRRALSMLHGHRDPITSWGLLPSASGVEGPRFVGKLHTGFRSVKVAPSIDFADARSFARRASYRIARSSTPWGV
jgi:hypothetical protein